MGDGAHRREDGTAADRIAALLLVPLLAGAAALASCQPEDGTDGAGTSSIESTVWLGGSGER